MGEQIVDTKDIEYTVDEHTEAVQKKAIEILEVFVSVAEKLGVEYYIYGGTLLGAVRHKGFIPWDDDIDVAMKREDYEKFIHNAQKYLPDNMFLQTYETDPEYPKVYAKIRNSDTTFIETAVKGRNMNHGVFIDIFALDPYSSKRASSLGFRIKKALSLLRISYAFDDPDTSAKLKRIRWISKLVYPTVNKAVRANDALFASCKSGDLLANNSRRACPAKYFNGTCELEFEGVKVTGPAGWEGVLGHMYGGDYMTLPPVEKRVSLHSTEVIDVDNSYKKYI